MTAMPLRPAEGLFPFLDETHQQLQRNLQRMGEIVLRFAEDRLQADDRSALREVVRWFSTVGRQHHLDEEDHVFPALLKSADEKMVQTTRRLRQDHGWIEQNWLELEPLLSAVVDNTHWFEPAVLVHGVQVYTQLTLDHLTLEELVAYPQARESMSAQALAQADADMARRRTLYLQQRQTKAESAPASA